MDEKIKQTIEEMELVMHNSCGCRYFNTKEMKLNNDRFFNREATALYNAGYRKESDTAREILEQFICRLVNARLVGVNDDLYYELLEAKDDLLKEKYEVNNG